MPAQNKNFIKKEARDKKAAMSTGDDEENVCSNVRSSCFCVFSPVQEWTLCPGWSQSDLGQWILKQVNHRCILDPFQPHSHLSCNIHSPSCIWSLILFSLVYSGGAHQVKITVKCTGIEHPLWWQRNKWLQLHFTGIEHPLWWQRNKWLQL